MHRHGECTGTVIITTGQALYHKMSWQKGSSSSSALTKCQGLPGPWSWHALCPASAGAPCGYRYHGGYAVMTQGRICTLHWLHALCALKLLSLRKKQYIQHCPPRQGCMHVTVSCPPRQGCMHVFRHASCSQTWLMYRERMATARPLLSSLDTQRVCVMVLSSSTSSRSRLSSWVLSSSTVT